MSRGCSQHDSPTELAEADRSTSWSASCSAGPLVVADGGVEGGGGLWAAIDTERVGGAGGGGAIVSLTGVRTNIIPIHS